MSLADVPFMIRNFLGINRRDGGEKVFDTEFWKIQNFYPASKGLFYKRQGSTADLTSSDLFGASKVTAIKRFYTLDKEFVTLYHCEPDTTPLPQPTADLGLSEISGGDLFNGVVETMRFCYTFVGLGIESNYNTRTRTGYTNTSHAWDQVGHQTIVVSDLTKGVRVTAPATFPSGVKLINVFAARGVNSEMTYVGSISSPGGTLDVKCYIGPATARTDTFDGANTDAVANSGGSIKPGTYYVGLAWVTDPSVNEGNRMNYTISSAPTLVTFQKTVTLSGSNNAIRIHCKGTGSGGASTNGARYAYVFIGRQKGDTHPLMFAGIIKDDAADVLFTTLPDNGNAQTHPKDYGGTITPFFVHGTFAEPSQYTERYGYFLIRRADNSVSPLFVSRSAYVLHTMDYFASSFGIQLHGMIATPSDTTWINWAQVSQGSYAPPTICTAVGLNFMVNGYNQIIQIDERCIGFMQVVAGTTKPPIANQAVIFKNQLVVGGAACGSQIYASNTFAFNNFAAGGTGSAPRFASVGDPVGEPITCLGVSSFTSANDGPSTRIAAFKRNRAWTLTNIPDPASGVGASMESLSAEVGVASAKTFANTPIGPIFMSGNGDVYILRQGEPYPIGNKVKDLLSHIVGKQALARMCSAVYHEHFYKLSYPSSASSTYADAQIWADLRTQDGDRISWYGPHLGLAIAAQATFDGEGDTGYRYAARADALGTMRLDDPSTFQDLGAPIVSVVETKTYRHRAEMNLKRWIGMMLDAYYDTSYAHSLLLELFSDDQYAQINKTLSTGTAVWDSAAYDSSNWGDALFQAIPWWLSSNLIGRTLKAKITHSDNAQFIIAAIGLPYRPEKRRISG